MYREVSGLEQQLNALEVSEMLAGFQERMTKIALFEPLFELERQRKTDKNGKPVAMMELGLLALLFFFEKKLLRSRKTSVKDFVTFLAAAISGHYALDQDELEDIARKIIQVFRPASGRKREFTFFHIGTGKEEVVYTAILRTDSYDSQSNTQYYALDEDGLELVFATKEFYLEFQLSIHQLLLRKQLEKGEFQGALRQIDEMHLDVETLHDRIHALEHEIKRSIVSEETLNRYSSLLADIYMRLMRENEEFNELREFVKETRDRIYAEREQLKQQRPYELIVRIGVELEKVHNEHTHLLQRSMELESHALRAARESLYYTGMNAFNFEQDIVSFVFGTPLPVEAMKGMLAPFLKVEQEKQWSLLTVFAKQQITGGEEGEAAQDSFPEMDEEHGDSAFVLRRKERFCEMLKALLVCLRDRGRSEVRLSEFIDYLHQNGYENMTVRRYFYDFWMIAHQRSPIRALAPGDDVEDIQRGLYEALTDVLQGQMLTVQEADGLIQVNERYSIQEMTIRLGGALDEL